MASVVGVPNPDSPAENSRITFRSHTNGLKRPGRGLYLLLTFDVRLHGYGLTSVVEREAIVGPWLQRQASDIKNSRQHIGHAARYIVLGLLLLIVFQVAFFQDGLAARVVVRDCGVAPVQAPSRELQQLVRAQALGVKVGVELVLHAIEERHHADGVGGCGYMLLRPCTLNAHGRYACRQEAPFAFVMQRLSMRKLIAGTQGLHVPG